MRRWLAAKWDDLLKRLGLRPSSLGFGSELGVRLIKNKEGSK